MPAATPDRVFTSSFDVFEATPSPTFAVPVTVNFALGDAVPIPTFVPLSYTTDALTADVPLPLTR